MLEEFGKFGVYPERQPLLTHILLPELNRDNAYKQEFVH